MVSRHQRPNVRASRQLWHTAFESPLQFLILVLVLGIGISVGVTPPNAIAGDFDPDLETFQQTIKPFFRKHCVSCHGKVEQEAGLRLDTIETDFGKSSTASRWTEIMDRINAGEMPPKKSAPPSNADLTSVVNWIVNELRRREAAIRSTGGRVVLRRLNRAEYLNTIRDLFGSNIKVPNDIPADPPAHGFDNIGAALQTSPMQIEKYIAAASDVLDQVIPKTPRPPEPVKWRFTLNDIYNDGLDKEKVYHRTYKHPLGWDGKSVRVKLMHNYDQPAPFPRRHQSMLTMTPRTSYIGVQSFRFPEGEHEYIIRIRAASMVPSRDEVVRRALKELEIRARNRGDIEEMRRHFRTSLDYQLGPPRMRLSESGGLRRVLDEIDVDAPISKPKVYEFRFRLNERSDGISIGNYYPKPQNRAVNVTLGRAFPQSLLFIDSVEIEGPVVEQWPPKSQTMLLGSANASEEKRARAVLAKFMPRAWRRPVTDNEMTAMMRVYQQRRADQPSFEEAIKVPLLAVLASPHFLFLNESSADISQATTGRTTTLNDFQIASRLSYFLWSSMPYDELFRLAKNNQLSDRKTLLKQVDRMLADKRSDQFVTNFAGQWLGMRKVGVNPPSRDIYARYDDHLEESMVRETLGFFREILHNDLDVRNFIKSDFVTINERLARQYHIEGVRGDHIRRFVAPPNSHRGGLLTQGSIHGITSNGTRTSPVLRGKWILETLLGDPPPPPRPNAGEIPQKVPGEGQVTVRQRLEIHRRVSACAACHNKIDPLGFALENFRADGSWEEREATAAGAWARDTDLVIDASARMPDGREFRGVDELQKILLQDEDKFLRNLAERIATYALGRGMEFSDRAWIDSLVVKMKKDDRTLHGLIKDIVTSKQFRSK